MENLLETDIFHFSIVFEKGQQICLQRHAHVVHRLSKCELIERVAPLPGHSLVVFHLLSPVLLEFSEFLAHFHILIKHLGGEHPVVVSVVLAELPCHVLLDRLFTCSQLGIELQALGGEGLRDLRLRVLRFLHLGQDFLSQRLVLTKRILQAGKELTLYLYRVGLATTLNQGV